MTKHLLNKSKNIIISEKVLQADNLRARLKGLIGNNDFKKNEALLIKNCKSIHTLFMSFSIDVVFVNKSMVVKNIYRGVKPYRFMLSDWAASHVLEFKEGALTCENISIGDQLSVGH